MNSSKHVPTLVFLLGIGVLFWSMRAFFHPSPLPVMPVKPLPPKAAAPAPAPVPAAVPAPKQLPSLMVNRVKSVVPAAPMPVVIQQHAQKVAADYLKSAALKMKLPEDMQFGRDQDGPVKILMGGTKPEKISLYLFSVDGKYTSERAQEYLKGYFEGDMNLNMKGDGSSFNNKSGFQDMTQFKGTNDKGEEFQAYFFRDPASNKSHMLMLMDKQLSKHPAQVRQLVESIQPDR